MITDLISHMSHILKHTFEGFFNEKEEKNIFFRNITLFKISQDKQTSTFN